MVSANWQLTSLEPSKLGPSTRFTTNWRQKWDHHRKESAQQRRLFGGEFLIFTSFFLCNYNTLSTQQSLQLTSNTLSVTTYLFYMYTNISVHFLPNVEIITFLYTCCNLSCLYSVFHSYKCRNVLQTFKDTSREFFCIKPLQCKSHTSCFVKFVCRIDHQSVEKYWIVHLGPCDDFYFIHETF